MWTDTDMEYLIGMVGDGIATDFGLNPERVQMCIQQTLNEFAATRERARRAALNRCTFKVIEGGKDAQGDI